MPKPRKLTVFLCYASQDRNIVQGLYDRLAKEPWIEPWMDIRKLIPGQKWEYEIENIVRKSDLVIVCISKNSVSKEGFVQKEIHLILELSERKPDGTIYIIPVRLEECDPPHRLRGWQFVNYYPSRMRRKRAYELLRKSLQARAGMFGIRSDEKASSVLLFRRAWLVGKRGEYMNKSIPVDQEISIGRLTSNTLRFKNPTISRRHAKVYKMKGRFYIIDLDSSSGTYQNEKRITSSMPYLLKSGDKLVIGDSQEFEFKGW
jgi:hypothetical protein